MFWRTLGLVWCFPIAAPLWALYVLPAWHAGLLQFDGWAQFGIARFRVVRQGNLHSRLWDRFYGLAGPGVVIMNTDTLVSELHQLRHADQWLALGTFYPLVWLIAGAAAGPHDNLLEQDARDWARREWNWHMQSQGGDRVSTRE